MSIGGYIRRTTFWITDLFKGRPIRRNYIEIKKVLENHETGNIYQEKYLNNLIDYATKNCKFYEKFKGKKITDFPVVNKNILIDNYDDIVVKSDVIPRQKTDKIHIQKTSGSTGTPFAVPQDTNKRNRRIAELKIFGEIAGYKSHERLAQCRVWTRWQSKSPKQQFTENILAVNISKMDEETVNNLCQTVIEKKVKALLGYANWFDQVVEYLNRHPEIAKKMKSLKVIFTGSEMLKDNTRTELKRLLNCNVVERYSNEEQGILGQQSIYSETEYYLNHGSYYFEVLKFDEDKPAEYGEWGRIVITDLFNYAFPMLRYDTGDTGVLEKGNKISKGWSFISKLYGRRLDLIFDTEGKPVQPMSLARILKNLNGIIQWQFVQLGQNEYAIRLNTTDKDAPVNCVKELKGILGDCAKIKIEFVDEIPILASGKRKPVVNEWKK